ncbi:MAG TPA: GNAT family N-acetyltransferase [Micromonosporaceae bacterium]
MTIEIRPMENTDGMKVLAVYAEALKGNDATFETNVPTWGEWSKMHLPAHRFVAVESSKTIRGWSALSRFSERREYAGVVECYTYVRADVRRTGVGTALLDALVRATEAQGLWTLQAHIFPENEAALRLHLKLGFRVVGTRERIGRHRGVWRDMLLLERRSPTVG